MKFRRTKWKPKRKLRKEDIPFLLTEYSVSKNLTYISTTLFIMSIAIIVMVIVTRLTVPNVELEYVIVFSIVAAAGSLSYAYYYRKKASKIAEVLEMKERLERYGIREED